MSESGDVWRKWFDRVGEVANVDVVNATTELVIAERDIHAAAVVADMSRLSTNEDALLRAIEDACHCWNMTPADYRTPLMQEAMNKLSGAHQAVLRSMSKT